MSDIIDQAADRHDIEVDRHVNQIRSQANAKRELEPKGSCHWCGEAFEKGHDDPRLFCDRDCAADHHKAKQLR